MRCSVRSSCAALSSASAAYARRNLTICRASFAALRLAAMATSRKRSAWRARTARRAIATEYAREVQRLIETGDWSEAPAFEDMFSDEWMPRAFYAYWCPDAAL